ncbi:6-phosphogluconate dehydrogenase [Caballeronia temeraria]|uniref:6-phosphogluconate dehydrogenase n=1 Tax=Caballeronia temeraria TaxID=1777137 RepID=A0A158DLN0_9BURK|nr:NAD(P)-dependent oxidoreductase [Caballeronia temeraria]SAK94677.1 6-phosphogluconate dehydrogenase [Caballeronia temeraria]
MAIGYVGIGSMGGALARRLLLKEPLLVYDANEAAVSKFVELGATPAADLSEVAAKCEIIFLCLPTSEHVEKAIFGVEGRAGLLQSAKHGALIVDQTTGDPTATRAMAQRLAEKGINLVDAPVSGGPQGADAGTIAIMVGASPTLYDRIAPVLHRISPNVFHAGGVGTGHVAKLANNLLSAGQRLASLEAIALAVKNGIEPQKAVDIINAGSGRNFFVEKFMSSHIISGKLNSGFTVGLSHKDVRLACKLGVDSGVTMFFGNIAREFQQMTINEMGADAQVNSVALMMDRLAGTHVVPEDYSLD